MLLHSGIIYLPLLCTYILCEAIVRNKISFLSVETVKIQDVDTTSQRQVKFPAKCQKILRAKFGFLCADWWNFIRGKMRAAKIKREQLFRMMHVGGKKDWGLLEWTEGEAGGGNVIISRDYVTACRFKTLPHTHMDNIA